MTFLAGLIVRLIGQPHCGQDCVFSPVWSAQKPFASLVFALDMTNTCDFLSKHVDFNTFNVLDTGVVGGRVKVERATPLGPI